MREDGDFMRCRKELIQDINVGVFSSLTATALWVGIGSLWVVLGANIFSIVINNVTKPWQYFIAGISVGALIVSSILIHKDSKNRFKPRFPVLSMDYVYKKVEAELFFFSREKILYTSLFNILALKDVDGIVRSHNWTGTPLSNLPSITTKDGHTIDVCDSTSIGKSIYIKFGVPLQRNKQTEFTLSYELDDSEKKMRSFLGQYVNNPTEKVVLRLGVPRNFVTNVNKCIYADNQCQIALSTPEIIQAGHLGNIDYYEWQVDNPSLLYYYRISWDFI